MSENKQYENEYKVQAVKLAKKIGAVNAANELQIPVNTLYGWIRKAKIGSLDIGCGERSPEESLNIAEENQQLRKRIKALEKENKRLSEMNEFLALQLSDYLSSPGCGAGITGAGIVKARVVYGEKGIEDVSYSPYTVRHVHSLALIQADHIDYTYKSAGREPLNRLFALRGACDDILIVKQGLLTDTSIANIALSDGTHWYTPAHPLLKGTKRAALLEEGILQEKDIRPEDLPSFSTVRLFNAMIDWGELELPVRNIIP